MKSFGHTPDAREASLFTLENPSGLRACISDFGATLVSVTTADRDGVPADVTLGFDSVTGYASPANPYFGASVGRHGNRIAHGRFTLDGLPYSLATNNAPGGIPCHLHGGTTGFHQRLWTVTDSSPTSVGLAYHSPAGEEGYPGTLQAHIRYTLTPDHELIWEATATADAPTLVNLIHHSYWNLSGRPTQSIEDHRLTLHADHYLPATPGMIPTGNILPVAGTPMDFRQPTLIGARIDQPFPALDDARGYDACWVLRSPTTPATLRPAARLEHPDSGRVLEILTDQPGIHFYTGNFLDGTVVGKRATAYPRRSGLCLETENFPDAPNHPHFPSAVLRPGETYRHRLVHRFSCVG